MSERAFWPYALKCLLIIGVASALGGLAFHRAIEGRLENLLEEENLRATQLAARFLREGTQLETVMIDVARLADARVTVIASDGRVLADSEGEASSMVNHGDRPEVIEAQRTGFGHTVRRSATVGADMLYTAVRWEDDAGNVKGVVRLSRALKRIRDLTGSFTELLWTSIPLVVILGVLVFYLLIEIRIAGSRRAS